MRSVSDLIFCSAWASEVSRAFSVSARMFDRSVSDAPPLLELADLAVKPIAGSGEPLDDLLRGVASDVRFHRLALQDPDVLGARGERLAHLGEQFLSGSGARTQRLEPQIHRIGFGLMALVGLIARGRQRDALVLGSRQADIHLLQPRPRGGQGVLAFGEATRQARRLCQRLIERRLQQALVILQQQELFPHERAFGLQFHNPLIGASGVIDENLVGLAQGPAIGGLLRQLALEIGDLRTRRHDFAGELGFVTLETAHGLLRQRQFPAHLLARASEFGRPLFQRADVGALAQFGAHALLAGAKLRQRIAQADIVALFLFQRLQRRADGLDQVAEGIFEIIERADPTGYRSAGCAAPRSPRRRGRRCRPMSARWALRRRVSQAWPAWAPQTPSMWMHRLYAQENG